MKIKKAVYMVLGFVGLALGAVGAGGTAASGVSIFAAGSLWLCKKFSETS